MALISDAYMKNLLKTVYLSGVTNNKYQNSPVLSAIGKESWGGGDEIRYACQYGNGGNFGSNYKTLANNPAVGAQNLEWKMTQGYMTGMFNVNQPEVLVSESDRGAYMKILNNKMAACFDGMSKTLATYLYGGKWGVMGKVPKGVEVASTQGSGNKMKVDSSTAIKMDIGTRFQVATEGQANKAKPSSELLTGVFTVTDIDDNEITFNATGATAEHIYEGDYIELYTARTGSEARGIEGLADILPAYFDRTGSDWTSYIKESFRGVDRSKATSRLAGQFVKAATGGKTDKSDALVTLLKKTKRAGGLNNMIIVNDETWDAIGQELGVQKNLWQASDGAASRQGATAGINELATAFGDAFIGRTVIDPYCTEGLAYSLEKDDLKFYDLGNVSRVINPVANDQMGKHDIESVGDQGFGSDIGAHLNMDKLFTVEQGGAGDYGPEFRIAAHVYGNYKLAKTASAGVAQL